MRLPASQMTLPGGYTIHLVYKTQKQMNQLNAADLLGYWEVGRGGGKIVINKDEPLWTRLRTFGHELVHAINDYSLWLDKTASMLEAEAKESQKLLEEEE